MHTIVKFHVVSVSGSVKYVPRNETALLFAQMVMSPTISPFVLQFIKRLGYTVEIAKQPLTANKD